MSDSHTESRQYKYGDKWGVEHITRYRYIRCVCSAQHQSSSQKPAFNMLPFRFLLAFILPVATAWSGAQQIINQAIALGAATTLSLAPMVSNAVDMSGSYEGE